MVEYFILRNIPATQHLQNIFSRPGWKVNMEYLGYDSWGFARGGVSKGLAMYDAVGFNVPATI